MDERGAGLLSSSFVGLCSVVGESVEREADALRPRSNSPPEDWPA